MDYRDNRQRWAESHQVVHFYAGQWCTFTPALTVHQVVIGCGAEIIARHPRSYEKGDMVFDPMHFLPLLEQKVGALDQAAPLKGWDLGVDCSAASTALPHSKATAKAGPGYLPPCTGFWKLAWARPANVNMSRFCA